MGRRFFFVNSLMETKSRRSYACSCVEVDASEKPVDSFDLVVNPEVECDTIHVGYLSCPQLCLQCSLFGHSESTCPVCKIPSEAITDLSSDIWPRITSLYWLRFLWML